MQVVHDFTTSAIALKRHFGDALRISRPLDTQFALEALQGDIRGTIGSAIKAFTGEHDLFSDAAYRCRLIVRTCRRSSCPVLSCTYVAQFHTDETKSIVSFCISQTRAYAHSWVFFMSRGLPASGTRGYRCLVVGRFSYFTTISAESVGDSRPRTTVWKTLGLDSRVRGSTSWNRLLY